MMATIKIYGASDDLVEVEGQVPGCNEYGAYDSPRYVELSSGDVFKVEYTDAGVWAVNIHKEGVLSRPPKGTKGVSITKESHGTGSDPEPYTDTVTVSGPFQWVEVWENYPPTVGEMKEKMGKLLTGSDDSLDLDGLLNDDEANAVWAIVAKAKRRVK